MLQGRRIVFGSARSVIETDPSATGARIMSDPFHWTIHLGRWAGVQVRIHLTLLLFVIGEVLHAALGREGQPVAETLTWLLLLLAALAIHELAHAVTAIRLGLEPDDVRLWPLGNLVGPMPPATLRSNENVKIAAVGMAASLTVALVVAAGVGLAWDVRMVWNPFGNAAGTGGAPVMADGKTVVAAFTWPWLLGWFGYLNWVIFLANLCPALPLDMGRVFRGVLETPWSGTSRDHLVGPVAARVCAIVLLLWGLVRLVQSAPGWWVLVGLAAVIYIIARLESRMLDEGGFFDDSVFGYDFSQGYTSLDANQATVRPRREGALRRWRRRRSELRRQRREAKEAAEDARMDTILEKLHREGRAALTDEEHRFLVRVSAKFKNRAGRGGV